MPKIVDAQELENLIRTVATFPLGALLEGVETASGHLSRRTLQRRLSALVAQGRLRVEGRGKSTRYFRVEGDASPVATSATTPPATRPDEDSLDVSPAAQEVRGLVRLPLHRRKPVGYNRAWLEAYRPTAPRICRPNCALVWPRQVIRPTARCPRAPMRARF